MSLRSHWVFHAHPPLCLYRSCAGDPVTAGKELYNILQQYEDRQDIAVLPDVAADLVRRAGRQEAAGCPFEPGPRQQPKDIDVVWEVDVVEGEFFIRLHRRLEQFATVPGWDYRTFRGLPRFADFLQRETARAAGTEAGRPPP